MQKDNKLHKESNHKSYYKNISSDFRRISWFCKGNRQNSHMGRSQMGSGSQERHQTLPNGTPKNSFLAHLGYSGPLAVSVVCQFGSNWVLEDYLEDISAFFWFVWFGLPPPALSRGGTLSSETLVKKLRNWDSRPSISCEPVSSHPGGVHQTSLKFDGKSKSCP